MENINKINEENEKINKEYQKILLEDTIPTKEELRREKLELEYQEDMEAQYGFEE